MELLEELVPQTTPSRGDSATCYHNRLLEITPTTARGDSKPLLKKYKSLKTEIQNLITSLEEDPTQGQPLGNDCYKIRLAIKSKGKGKSGGARVITCVKVVDSFVYLLTIYSKSEKDNISDKELQELIEGLD